MSLASEYNKAIGEVALLRPRTWYASNEAASALVNDQGQLVLNIRVPSLSPEAALDLARYIQEVLG